ncbi:hypothetical protein [Stenotrophomonas sp. TWI602]|uniref:hypothetical protein n=1 Tax=Stenotrophomonas sp. TWI602 TaxID=3136786 RepID=UPI00320996F0
MTIPDDLALTLTFDDFKRFLIEKYKNNECPVCKQLAGIELMFIRGGGGLPEVAGYYGLIQSREPLDTIPASTTITGFALPMLPVSCKNCGYVQLFNVTTISQWIKKHPGLEATAREGENDV